MLNNKYSVLSKLKALGLTEEEARIYQELLEGPSTHLKLARATSINRTKIYRIVDQLEKRSLINVRSDDRGTFLIASDPSTLEIELVAQEDSLKSQRQAFVSLLPLLESMQKDDSGDFAVHTYEGEEGFRQMLWHELKARGELLLFGAGTLSDLVVTNEYWKQNYRQRIRESGYDVRVMANPGDIQKVLDKENGDYKSRIVPADTLPLENQITIYNDTVAIYCWRVKGKKTGVEIVNKGLADTMRSTFELYWRAAAKPPRQ